MVKLVPIISVVGKSKVGKTTLLEKLLPEIKKRGYRVAVIKHDVHGFDIDRPGKDTWKHARAGADIVVISSPQKMAIIEKVDREKTLAEIASKLDHVDLIITEGYKRQDKPKIEVFRSEVSDTLLCKR
jgi:molybdopterin-guanine dinucleotide biosynthesis protein B